jgi:hypothetical protein
MYTGVIDGGSGRAKEPFNTRLESVAAHPKNYSGVMATATVSHHE